MALRESILCFYPELKGSTLVLDDSTLLNLKCVNNGTLIVYPTWSGAGIAKSIQIIKSFYAGGIYRNNHHNRYRLHDP